VAQIHRPEAERRLEPREALAVRYAERMAMGRLLVITGTHDGACEIYVPPS
jgi:hypothetical protein